MAKVYDVPADDLVSRLAEILKTEAEAVIVVFKENPKENWFKAGSQL